MCSSICFYNIFKCLFEFKRKMPNCCQNNFEFENIYENNLPILFDFILK